MAAQPTRVGVGSGGPVEVEVALVGIGCEGLDVDVKFIGEYVSELEATSLEDEVGSGVLCLELRLNVKVVRLGIVGVVVIMPLDAVIGTLATGRLLDSEAKVVGTSEEMFATGLIVTDEVIIVILVLRVSQVLV